MEEDIGGHGAYGPDSLGFQLTAEYLRRRQAGSSDYESEELEEAKEKIRELNQELKETKEENRNLKQKMKAALKEIQKLNQWNSKQAMTRKRW